MGRSQGTLSKEKEGMATRATPPKMTKEERRKKYTEIARKRREKQEGRGKGGRYDGGNHSKKNVCYNCRQPGHTVANCPSANARDLSSVNAVAEGQSSGLLCYKCGSTEHALHACPKRKQGDRNDLPYATCFVCKEKGHLASRCPKNSNGIYVHGGSCRVCGSQQHLASECPEKKRKKKVDHQGGVEDRDVEDLLEHEPSKQKSTAGKAEPSDPAKQSKPKKRRVVTF
mmetsp:Transcript_20023/g.32336  ORF Transcript_20023/g.32336 Transcript_20023/m.32336 type:complete len:228 (+) Transcript_20023:98-781(+)|eukprot:CAMPEP_0178783590 /NCGR_PEP_ID=MMETSP0745-20121128/3768_1 /TAXON_ID=913974 /ORGANISM="Nitzschia punctata, Strain CCMP561" /LENGTH=227 /DNA_ID=CAMNT_0020441115 /DNA_START=52 /DNA_END=735 /DNA_ORIENTATION=+